MKKIIFTIIILTLGLGTKMTALAKPQTMPDGTVFDAEYYADTYPDVKAAFGMDEQALYNHYVQYGKNEGRSPAPGQTASPSQNPGSSVVIEEGDENYWRASVVSTGFYTNYKLNCTEMSYKDPAVGMVRSDMSADPYYQAIRSEIIEVIQSSEDKTRIIYSSKYIYNPGDWEVEKHYNQVRFNLSIDLVKDGILKHCYLMNNPADGAVHYGEMDHDLITVGFLNYEDEDRKEVIQKHPELKGYY